MLRHDDPGAEEFYARESSGECDGIINVYTLSKHLFVRMDKILA